MNLRLKRTPGVYLVGFMASGKTTIGRLLAERLGWPFSDLDQEIEAAERCSVADLVEARGEEEFRRIEVRTLAIHVRQIEAGRPLVLAVGGGAFIDPASRDAMLGNGVAVWLDCPFEIVERRVGWPSTRPLARDPERFAALYRERQPAYSLADVRIAIHSDDPAAAVDAILAHPIFK